MIFGLGKKKAKSRPRDLKPGEHDFSLNSGERQTATRLEDVREDHLARYRWAAELLSSQPERFNKGVILDVFCGTGYGTFLVSEKVGCHAMGIEGSAEALDVAHKYFSSEGTFFSEKVFPFSLPKENFDAVISFESLEHIEDCTRFLDELTAAVKPGGTLLLSSPNQEILKLELNRNPFHHKHFAASEVVELVKARGFEHKVTMSQDVYILEQGKVTGYRKSEEMGLKEGATGQFNLYQFDKPGVES